MYKPLFINFEGLDKCGKDTQADWLYEKMIELGRSVEISNEPTQDSEAGQRIWRILQHQEAAPSPEEMQLLYVADRALHVQNFIVPTLNQKKSVIEVRYLFSTLAYGVAFGVDYNVLKQPQLAFPIPDITLFIKISAAEAIRRLSLESGEAHYFEKEEKLKKIAAAYEQILPDWPNIVVINGEQSKEKVWSDIWEIVSKKLL